MSAPQVVLEGVTRRFGDRTAVAPLSMTVDAGDRIGIVGESGSGKSTLARMIAGLDRPSGGTITIDGRTQTAWMSTTAGRRDLRRRIQLVAQDTTSTFDPRRTVRDALRTPARLLGGHSGARADAVAEEAVADMGLPPAMLDRHPHELSGGQRQRMAIARAMVVRPGLLVCDEAVSALDVSVQGAVLNRIVRYCREHGAGLLFVSHGLPATAFATDDLLVMLHGHVVEHGRTGAVLSSPVHDHTAALVAAHA
ncbi:MULTISPECIES: ABC transporter ATP-binding protein [unclassified Pseudonocardia]|uniref:ABC transporter ATP-binding protein n=1 Tax=unclassified Pseudonocardia TaxID=2619320 RepID=UPI0001FFE931|nr:MULTISPECIES: ABC transporter ATP-binding protein [unclassified Pseudonocardia]ALE72976.1 peptide ABC transporter ATP-binding protein [Pseudonocardia sp. EC080625-04]ALL76305.1 peptide ABC transporter ATP-binding protein [Pseudonocardia sp. EC080610-09]ALL83332.1 peptide ABC transporter ATP-binding protein [Pseudonocardia sp. EC080619-01]OLM19453.1 Oligopeptide transport ATP-binding protein OppF [Pseudonocardia sp. Ae707_Ps1]